jgi:methylenetetrahydrofolate dehydrogenase (NADP+)/methenyltetrahydrofolate cyclohydrolase
MHTLIDGKKLANMVLDQLKNEVEQLRRKKIVPHLGIILIGHNPASEVYVGKKILAAEQIGVKCTLYRLPESVTQSQLIAKMSRLQKNNEISGLIVQLPIPEHLYTPTVLNAIQPEYDVDCLTDVNIGRLAMGTALIEPPTAGAIFSIIRNLAISLPGKNVAIMGTGALVGKPLALMFMNARASITTINSATRNVSKKTRMADIVVSGVGKAGLIKGSMIKKGAVVLDAGIDFTPQGKVVGDVEILSTIKKARFLTPTPGGVGPLTVAILLKNTVTLCKKRRTKN